MAHNGYARSIKPVHTSADGDTIYALSVGKVQADEDMIGTLAADVMSDAMYDLAVIGASSSDIAWASWADRSLNSTLVSGWMNDGDSSNIDRVGHRRWILNPAMGKTGFGSVSGQNGTYSAVYAFDDSNSNGQEYGVMWPAQNMPVEYFGTSYPWSISMGYAVNESDIQVTLTRESDGKNWIFTN